MAAMAAPPDTREFAVDLRSLPTNIDIGDCKVWLLPHKLMCVSFEGPLVYFYFSSPQHAREAASYLPETVPVLFPPPPRTAAPELDVYVGKPSSKLFFARPSPYLTVTAVAKLANRKGLKACDNAERGFLLSFESVGLARDVFEELSQETNLTPYFWPPTYPEPEEDSAQPGHGSLIVHDVHAPFPSFVNLAFSLPDIVGVSVTEKKDAYLLRFRGGVAARRAARVLATNFNLRAPLITSSPAQFPIPPPLENVAHRTCTIKIVVDGKFAVEVVNNSLKPLLETYGGFVAAWRIELGVYVARFNTVENAALGRKGISFSTGIGDICFVQDEPELAAPPAPEYLKNMPTLPRKDLSVATQNDGGGNAGVDVVAGGDVQMGGNVDVSGPADTVSQRMRHFLILKNLAPTVTTQDTIDFFARVGAWAAVLHGQDAYIFFDLDTSRDRTRDLLDFLRSLETDHQHGLRSEIGKVVPPEVTMEIVRALGM
ncbi:hypothetical protein BDK51DRAFT_35106 [Blyttiomyces helicus]|uniref:Uncharacterized protein n=1 Tax=Blyttiomyces helicus TaxID=388810 RepID=A0A4P9WL48_9FUNG|nr:hypothetical protein BDK51DRAFT_35106 [Blyttiomyces helicus]|eukprot:RKO91346.1 hypothetical protein BDK51DRAFT_35106 [Blyttiomyces helicus]